MRWRQWLLLAGSGLMVGCLAAREGSSTCDGRLVLDGGVCVGLGPISETGFECPLTMPFMYASEGWIICSDQRLDEPQVGAALDEATLDWPARPDVLGQPDTWSEVVGSDSGWAQPETSGPVGGCTEPANCSSPAVPNPLSGEHLSCAAGDADDRLVCGGDQAPCLDLDEDGKYDCVEHCVDADRNGRLDCLEPCRLLVDGPDVPDYVRVFGITMCSFVGDGPCVDGDGDGRPWCAFQAPCGVKELGPVGDAWACSNPLSCTVDADGDGSCEGDDMDDHDPEVFFVANVLVDAHEAPEGLRGWYRVARIAPYRVLGIPLCAFDIRRYLDRSELVTNWFERDCDDSAGFYTSPTQIARTHRVCSGPSQGTNDYFCFDAAELCHDADGKIAACP